MRSVRLGVTCLIGFALALGALGPAFARTQHGSKYGGTLVVGLSAEPDTLDPTLSVAFTAVEVYRTFCEKLYDLDSEGQVVPQLAAALPVVSRDKLTYTIQLRKGIHFNDGTPFNAQAVVTTIQRNLTLEGSTRADFLESIGGVTASKPYTVVLHLRSRFASLLDNLATPAAAILSPSQLAKLGDDFATNPICVGAFMYDHRVAGDHITVIKSPYYYNRGAVYLDKIVFKVVSNPAAAAAALKAGDLDVLSSVSPTELDGLAQSSSMRIVEKDTFGYQAIRVNIGNENGAGKPPYSNVGTPLASSAALRKAFEEAIDRTTMSRVVFGSHVQVGCTAVAPASPWFDPNIRCTPYDPADAKRLVATSGVRDPTVHLLTPASSDNLRLAQFIQQQEAAVGINVVIDPTATAADRVQAGNFDAALGGWAGSRSDPDSNIYTQLTTTGFRNTGGYSNPQLDLIMENGRKAITTKARKTLYHAAEQIILNDRPLIYLYHPIRYTAFNTTEVTGVQLGPDNLVRVAFAQLR